MAASVFAERVRSKAIVIAFFVFSTLFRFSWAAVKYDSSAVPFTPGCSSHLEGPRLLQMAALRGFEPTSHRTLESLRRWDQDVIHLVTADGPVFEMDAKSLRLRRVGPNRPRGWRARDYVFEPPRVARVVTEREAFPFVYRHFASVAPKGKFREDVSLAWFDRAAPRQAAEVIVLRGHQRLNSVEQIFNEDGVPRLLAAGPGGLQFIDLLSGSIDLRPSRGIAAEVDLTAVPEPGGRRLALIHRNILSTETMIHVTELKTLSTSVAASLSPETAVGTLPRLMDHAEATADGRRIVMRSGEAGLWIMDWDARREPRLVFDGPVNHVTTSPDGGFAAFVTPGLRNDQIHLLNLQTNERPTSFNISDLVRDVTVLSRERTERGPARVSIADMTRIKISSLAFVDRDHLLAVVHLTQRKHPGHVQRLLRLAWR